MRKWSEGEDLQVIRLFLALAYSLSFFWQVEELTELIMKNKKTAFVVDDDTRYAESIRLNMEKLGFEVHCFSTGAGLMAQLSANPDLIILDHDLGEDITGLEYLQMIREVGKKIPVLFLLAQNDIKEAAQALRFGAYDYIEKGSASFMRLRTSLYDLDIEKKRKFLTALRSFRQGVFNLYNIY